jgi:hypothetical protein
VSTPLPTYNDQRTVDDIRNFVKRKKDGGVSRAELEAGLFGPRRNGKGKTLAEHMFGRDVPNATAVCRKYIDDFLPHPLEALRSLNKGAAFPDIEEALRLAAMNICGLDELARTMVIEECFHKLRELGINAPGRLVSAAFESSSGSESTDTGHSLTPEDPEPWPEVVDGVELLKEIKDTIQRYVVLTGSTSSPQAWFIVFTTIVFLVVNL